MRKPNEVATTFYVDKDLKQEVKDILTDMGLSTSAAIRLFFQQVVEKQSISFLYQDESEDDIEKEVIN